MKEVIIGVYSTEPNGTNTPRTPTGTMPTDSPIPERSSRTSISALFVQRVLVQSPETPLETCVQRETPPETCLPYKMGIGGVVLFQCMWSVGRLVALDTFLDSYVENGRRGAISKGGGIPEAPGYAESASRQTEDCNGPRSCRDSV